MLVQVAKVIKWNLIVSEHTLKCIIATGVEKNLHLSACHTTWSPDTIVGCFESNLANVQVSVIFFLVLVCV